MTVRPADLHPTEPVFLQVICSGISGIVIPAALRSRITEAEYAQLERMMFAKAALQGVTINDDPTGRWGDQREDD